MTLHTIDLHFQDTAGLIAAYAIVTGNSVALVETGPASCRRSLLAGLREQGIEPSDVKRVFLTHFHLDHSGDAGWWAQQGAQVYVHPLGAPHIVDPSKLIDSASRIYGDQMTTLWGEILAAPSDKVTAVNDMDRVDWDGLSVTAWDTPGHARHHHAWVMGAECFTGDVAGVRLEHSAYISVAAAPPQFEAPAYIASVQRLRAAQFEKLHLTHFGSVTNADQHLARYEQRILDVTQSIRNEPERYTANEHEVASRLGVEDALWQRYELANGTAMCASGIARYVSKNPH